MEKIQLFSLEKGVIKEGNINLIKKKHRLFSEKEIHEILLKNILKEISGKSIYISKIEDDIFLVFEESGKIFIFDISDLSKNLKEYRELKFFLDIIPIGIYQTDLSGKIIKANRHLFKLLKVENLLLEELNVNKFYTEKIKRNKLLKRIKKKRVNMLEYPLKDAEGNEIWVKDYVLNTENQFYGILIDITKEKEYKRRLYRKDLILSAIAGGIEKLLTLPYEEEVFLDVIKTLGKITDSERISLVEFKSTKDFSFTERVTYSEKNLEGIKPVSKYSFSNIDKLFKREKYLINPEVFIETNNPKIKTILLLPLKSDNNLWGIMIFENFNESKEWSKEEINALMVSANLFRVAILQRKMLDRLISQSISDDLTGLHNRRGFFDRANNFLENQTKKKPFLFFIDFDNLKNINDNFGHIEGDRALKEISGILKDVCRKSDVVARIGGDEFVILTDVDKFKDAMNLKKRINEKIEEINKSAILPYKLSVSIGIAQYEPEKISSIDQLILLSDKNMYEEKVRKKK